MIEVDSKEMLKLFSNLKPRNQSKVFKKALKQAGQILVKETRQTLRRSGIKGITKKHPEWKGISLNSGIKIGKQKKDDETKVHIMGDFRLKFFEMGTKRRVYTTKNGKTHNTGSIRGINFFSRAKAVKEKEVFESINRLIAENIRKISRQ